MNREKVIEFFDSLADSWDEGMVINEEIISTILDNAHLGKGADVLDVACGTGVLIPFYLKREVSSVTAIDISPRMTDIARAKFADEEKVKVICGDVMEFSDFHLYDAIVVYNALPHFPDDRELIQKLSSLLKQGGYLTIAHGMSRDKINNHHSNVSIEVKKPLKAVEELAEIMSEFLKVTTIISNEDMYQVAGRKV
ncbi:MAG: class I SAM-dependent methyltransferase [Erysipelotrichaceae bacterium]|nr:class I SAM-dependent methyltransferase [Erysipelotrichaceae bacterium]